MNRELEHFGLIKITGPGAQKFLQGQLTTNVEKLPPNAYILSAHCNPQGRVISLFHLINFNDSYYFFLPRDLIIPTLNALKKYSVFYKLTMEEVDINSESPALTKICEQCHIDILTQHLPTIHACTSAKFLPHDLNLQNFNAIDFNKGCYTGQEIIARMHYRGKPKNSLYRYKITDTDINIGQDIYLNEHPCGTIVNVCESQNKSYALCVMNQNSHLETQFNIQNKICHLQLVPYNEMNQ